MKLNIRTDARNIENLIKKNKLQLEGTTEKMCRVSGSVENIKNIKDDLDRAKIVYFDHVEYQIPSTQKSIDKPLTFVDKKKKRK